MRRVDTKIALVGVAAAALALTACGKEGPALSKSASQDEEATFETPALGPIGPQSPTVGALLNQVPIYEKAHAKAKIIGTLRAGDRLPRSEKSHSNDQCATGWYAIAPRGYVCSEKHVSIDPDHPTLQAMSLRPQLDRPLPYTYARTTQVTGLFHKRGQDSVQVEGRLARNTVMAIVGSWTAPDESREPQRLGLRMDGTFVRADDLEAAAGSDFRGFPIGEEIELPVAFVVRRGVSAWKLDKSDVQKRDVLGYHERIPLTGRYRTIQDRRFWEAKDGRWIRHKDVTLARQRYEFPEFVKEGTKWLDVSVVTGAAVAYEGKKPVYATLVSVGRDRLGEPEISASTPRGAFRVISKHITRRLQPTPDTPLHDAPWAFELENGSWLQATPRHDRFGIEHTDGEIEIAPADGQFLFAWAPPALPPGWHGVAASDKDATLIVNVRK